MQHRQFSSRWHNMSCCTSSSFYTETTVTEAHRQTENISQAALSLDSFHFPEILHNLIRLSDLNLSVPLVLVNKVEAFY